MTEARSKPSRTFHVNWTLKGYKSSLGHYVIDAPNEREARREAKRYLGARFPYGKGWRITYVTDVEAEAEQARARAEYDAVDPVERAAANGRADHAAGWNIDVCPYPEDGPERSAWIDAWDNAEEAAGNHGKRLPD